MDLEQEIERIAKKYNYMIFGEVARQDFSKALREMAAFTRKQIEEELKSTKIAIDRAAAPLSAPPITFSKGAPPNTWGFSEHLEVLPEKAEVASSPSPTQADKCQICEGRQGGVRGNENVIHGVIVCDYCSVLILRVENLGWKRGEWVKVTPEEELLHIAICQACGILNYLVLDAETNKAHTILRKALEDYANKKEAANG